MAAAGLGELRRRAATAARRGTTPRRPAGPRSARRRSASGWRCSAGHSRHGSWWWSHERGVHGVPLEASDPAPCATSRTPGRARGPSPASHSHSRAARLSAQTRSRSMTRSPIERAARRGEALRATRGRVAPRRTPGPARSRGGRGSATAGSTGSTGWVAGARWERGAWSGLARPRWHRTRWPNGRGRPRRPSRRCPSCGATGWRRAARPSPTRAGRREGGSAPG